ncbi:MULTISPECIES: potassium channel family protein [unclassified Kitasatospora]|uniref:potassium channel family protein n=1 Tax=unclassified Kitasatospora TaxID=2633591 RepID=UPI0007C7D15C|nr:MULTISPECIES: potassium channel family protein [unclassified Kitasatospora]
MDPKQRGPRHGVLLAWLLAPLSAVVLMTGYFTVPLGRFGPDHPLLSWISFTVALGVLALLLLRQVRYVLVPSGRGRPAVGIALLICLSLVIFAAAYLALSRQDGEFTNLSTRLDALYFTVITTSTIGYGDITPSGQSARLVVMLQIAFNLVFLTTAAGALTTQLRTRFTTRANARTHADETSPQPGEQADDT